MRVFQTDKHEQSDLNQWCDVGRGVMIINPADLASDKPVTFINPLEYGSLIGLFFYIYIFLSQGFISVNLSAF